MTHKDLGVQEKLLLSALTLTEQGKGRFSAEDLVVSAWRRYPDAFGLSGYTNESGSPLYPNSNRIYAEIMGSKPLRKNGLLRKVGSKIYELTDAGKAKALSLSERKQSPGAEKWTLAREQVEFVRRLFDSKAATKVRTSKAEEVSFFDACGFWGISAGSNAKDLWSRFAEIESVLAAAAKSMGGKDAVRLTHGTGEFSIRDVNLLEETHRLLQERFAAEVEHIKSRRDER